MPRVPHLQGSMAGPPGPLLSSKNAQVMNCVCPTALSRNLPASWVAPAAEPSYFGDPWGRPPVPKRVQRATRRWWQRMSNGAHSSAPLSIRSNQRSRDHVPPVPQLEGSMAGPRGSLLSSKNAEVMSCLCFYLPRRPHPTKTKEGTRSDHFPLLIALLVEAWSNGASQEGS